MAKRKAYTIRKYRGDDQYSWAVFRTDTGMPVATGLCRREAQYHRDRLEKIKKETHHTTHR